MLEIVTHTYNIVGLSNAWGGFEKRPLMPYRPASSSRPSRYCSVQCVKACLEPDVSCDEAKVPVAPTSSQRFGSDAPSIELVFIWLG